MKGCFCQISGIFCGPKKGPKIVLAELKACFYNSAVIFEDLNLALQFKIKFGWFVKRAKKIFDEMSKSGKYNSISHVGVSIFWSEK